MSASLGIGSPLLRRPGAGDQAEPVHRLAQTCPSPWGSRAQPRTRSPLSTFRQPPGWERDRPEPPADWSEERCAHLRAALQRTNPPSNTASHLFSSVTCNHMARFPAEIRTPPGFVFLVGSRRVPFKPEPRLPWRFPSLACPGASALSQTFMPGFAKPGRASRERSLGAFGLCSQGCRKQSSHRTPLRHALSQGGEEPPLPFPGKNADFGGVGAECSPAAAVVRL